MEPLPSPSAPLPEDIERQLQRLDAHPLMLDAPLRPKALRWLIEFQRRGMYDPKRNPNLGALNLFTEFYEHVGTTFPNPKPNDQQAQEDRKKLIVDRGKALFSDLDRALNKYYEPGGDGANDPIRIKLQRGHGRFYQPIIVANDSPSISRFKDKWDFDDLQSALLHSPRDAEIKILITFFVDHFVLLDMLDDLLLHDPRKMEIILISPHESNVPLLQRRYGIDGELRVNFTWEAARRQILGQLDDFRRYQKKLANASGEHGSIDLLVHESVPTLVSYQIGDEMLIGMLLTRKTFDDGPMILVKRGDYLWSVFEENYNTVRQNAVPYDPK